MTGMMENVTNVKTNKTITADVEVASNANGVILAHASAESLR
jgi:hypothetical protein